jgi:hypothetical protein
VSTVPAVIAALVALGEATLSLDDWQVIDGPLGTVTTPRERLLLVGDTEIVSPAEFDSYGGASQAERYTLPLLVSVTLTGFDTLPAARTEAFTAHEEIRDAILASPGRNLGLTAQSVVDVFPSVERRVQQFATENGRSVAIRFGVDVYAQLT